MDRFWSKVKKAGPDDCWEWQAATTGGYGRFMFNGKPHIASRFAFELTHGDIPHGQVVRHTCDNPKCCNPAHLVLGTQKENLHDAITRGRAGISKLQPQQVSEIRTKLKTATKKYGLNVRLAKEYGVSVSSIERIKSGKTWAYEEAS